ncbi:MAG: phosphate acyltransferase [Elusimicrobiota bacterium]
MNWLNKIKEEAKNKDKLIVFPEGKDERIVEAAKIVARENIARPLVLTDKKIDNMQTEPATKKPLRKACSLVADNKCDGMVAGARYKTASVIRNSLRTIGIKENNNVVSSFFLMTGSDTDLGQEGAYLFADCAVIPEPDSQQLAEITKQTAENAKKILGWYPRVALLSFSTKGSAKHKLIDKVKNAKENLDKENTDFLYDGELQLDSAVVPGVARRKDKNGTLKGKANILIFPDLNAGNIAYKITERLGNYSAVGPILQGFKKPVNDLSRGCSVDDIVNVTAFTVLQTN